MQIASLYVGRFFARVLPSKRVGYGRFSFELNPGEFTIKEHVAVVLAYVPSIPAILLSLTPTHQCQHRSHQRQPHPQSPTSRTR